MHHRLILKLLLLLPLLMQVGCTSLLPRSRNITESPWLEYSAAQSSFDQIKIGETTLEDLKKLGFDVNQATNLKVLNYLDIASTVQVIPLHELDPGLQACIKARELCRAYVFEPRRVYTRRVGNFWLDSFNFRRKSHETGWRFKALIVLVNNHVAYKLASGEPNVDQYQDKVNPLGPLQSPADIITGSLF